MPDDSDSPVRPRAVGPGEPSRPRPSPPGEWLFEQRGQVFGPFSGADIGALLARGTLEPGTRVRGEDGEWRALKDVPALQPVLEEWQARARVEREVRLARARALRATGARWTAVGVLVVSVVALVVAGAVALALRRPWERGNALLDGFEVSVTVGAGHVARGEGPVAGDEIAVPGGRSLRDPARSQGAAPTSRRAQAGPRRELRAQAPATAGPLVAADYDPARIEAVVARSKETLAPCVRDEVRRSPELSGDLPIEFAVGNDGRVVALWIQDPRFRSGPLHECLLTALRRWSFDPFSGQRPIVALSFHLGGR